LFSNFCPYLICTVRNSGGKGKMFFQSRKIKSKKKRDCRFFLQSALGQPSAQNHTAQWLLCPGGGDGISAENILPVIANAVKQSLHVWAIASFVAMTGISDIIFASVARQSRYNRRPGLLHCARNDGEKKYPA
jgi:hypothetical protein